MKHGKISFIEFIVLFFLVIHLLLFTSSHAFYSSSTLALDTDISDKKLQTGPENNSLAGTNTTTTTTTTKNFDLNELIFSDPFYLSNDTLILDKIFLGENSSDTINMEVQFFVEKGLINASLVTYNVGYYVEDPNLFGSSSESNSLSNSHDTGSVNTYAKGSGIFLTENDDIIEWDALDQIINKSKDTFLYAGIIFFSSHDSKNNALSFLTNQVGLYEFSIDSNINTSTTTATKTTTDINTTKAPNMTHRTIWSWPYTFK
jgi:hypothetical protein